MTTARDSIREAAQAHGWELIKDFTCWIKARKGDELLDVTFTKGGRTVDYGALFFIPAQPELRPGASHQIDHLDRGTKAKRARVHGWVAHAEVRKAQRAG